MTLKKGIFENYIKERETTPVLVNKTDNSKYSHNRVFDEPDSLRKAHQENTLSKHAASPAPVSEPSVQNLYIDKKETSKHLVRDDAAKESPLQQAKEPVLQQPKQLTSQQAKEPALQQAKEPISNQLVTNKVSISNQLVTDISNQLVTNKEPISNQLVTHSQIGSAQRKHNKEPISNPISNRNKEPISNQLVSQLVTAQDTVAKTNGHQRKILFYIVDDCVYRGKLVSGFITNETLRHLTQTDADTVKTATQRLINKNLIKREKGQRGKGGFCSFLITEEVREAVLKEKRNSSISNQLVSQLVTDISNQLVTNKVSNKEPSASSSSSIKDLNTTTTHLGDEWNFDIAAYGRFGFTTTQLKQIASLGTISANDVQQSLMEFSYDLDHHALPPIKTTKINFLMGLLRSGNSYISEGFKNEQDATILEMARRSKAKQESLLNAKFEAWVDALADGQKMKIEEKMPTHLMVWYRTHGIGHPDLRNWLFEYFLQNL